MATSIKKSDAAFNQQMKNFASKIGTYASVLGITAAEVASVKADAAAFDYMYHSQIAIQSFTQNFTAYKVLLRSGGGQLLGAVPALPVLPAPPSMPAADVAFRFRSIIQRIVYSFGYTRAIGEDLGIVAPVSTFNATAGKPRFSIGFVSGGCPNLRWKKGKYQGVEIWKDSGNGFVKLDRDMRPDYVDKSPLPPAGVPAVWHYKMIYLMNDELAGSWSDVVSVTVLG